MLFSRKSTRELHAFDIFHPIVPLVFFAVILVFCMIAIHPVYVVLSFGGALAFAVYLKGAAALKMLAWQTPLVLFVAFINPLFSTVGSTVLFSFGSKAFYAEALGFGACMGMMLVSVLLWFSNASAVLTSDKVMTVFGNSAPTIALMISMVMRLMPQFVQRGTQIDQVAQACSATQGQDIKHTMGARVRLTSVLMAWSMENSLESADAMRARGWGVAKKRTTYQRYHFRAFDAVALTGLLLFAALNGILMNQAYGGFAFYPTMTPLSWWWGYIPYAALVVVPLMVCLVDDLRWKVLGGA